MIRNLIKNQIKYIPSYNNALRFITTTNNSNNIINTTNKPTLTLLSLPKETIGSEDIFRPPKKYDRFKVITKEKQIELFYQALKEAGGVTLEDFQKLNYLKFTASKSGCTIFGYYGGSKTRLAYSLFPEYPWRAWLFNRRGLELYNPRSDSNYNYKLEFEWWAEKYNLTDNLDLWYDVNFNHFKKQCKILNLSSLQLREHLIQVYPHHKFYLWKFRFPGSEIWSRPEVVAEYRQHLINATGFKTMEEFYFISVNRIKEYNGFALIHLHKSNIQKIMSHIFPEYNWDPQLFKGTETMKKLLKQYKESNPKQPKPSNPLKLPSIARLKGITSIFKRKDIENLLNK